MVHQLFKKVQHDLMGKGRKLQGKLEGAFCYFESHLLGQ
jgi:hypothetical protein